MSAQVEWAAAHEVRCEVTIAGDVSGNEVLDADVPVLVLDGGGGGLYAIDGSPADLRALARRITDAVTDYERALPAEPRESASRGGAYCADCGEQAQKSGYGALIIRHREDCPALRRDA